MPEGITLSGYRRDKYKSDGVKRVYLFQLMGLSVLSTGVQLLAVGLPIFAYGTVLNSGPYKTLGSLATVLLGGIVGMIVTKVEVRHGKSAW